MWDWWDFLWGRTAEQWQAIGAVGTLVLALFASIIAFIQVRQARKLRLEQSQPQVIVDFEPRSIFIEIVIRNIGATTARDVKVSFKPELQSVLFEKEKTKLPTSKILREGIPTMPPGKEYRMLFERTPDRYERTDLPRAYEATVEFRDSRGKHYREPYVLDFDTYYGYSSIAVYDLHDAANALQGIETTLNRWSESGRGLKVFSRDGDAKDAKMRGRSLAGTPFEEAKTEGLLNRETSFLAQIIGRLWRRDDNRQDPL